MLKKQKNQRARNIGCKSWEEDVQIPRLMV